jgi:hypothetical protein
MVSPFLINGLLICLAPLADNHPLKAVSQGRETGATQGNERFCLLFAEPLGAQAGIMTHTIHRANNRIRPAQHFTQPRLLIFPAAIVVDKPASTILYDLPVMRHQGMLPPNIENTATAQVKTRAVLALTTVTSRAGSRQQNTRSFHSPSAPTG